MTADGIRRDVAAGRLYVVERGVYTFERPEAVWDEYAARVVAAAMNRPSSVVSHESAAALHGIPVFRGSRERIHFTIDAEHGGGRRPRRHIHPRPLRPEDVVRIDGIAVTSRARTALDIATSGSLTQGICAIDAVCLRPRYPDPGAPPPVPVAELRSTLDALGPRCRGVARARTAIARSVDRSESLGESLSRCLMSEWRLPPPTLQCRYLLGGHEYWADFDWNGRLIGEFDGMGKYDDPERIEREKQRDSDFRGAGIRVLHWTWDDVCNRARFFSIITGALLDAGILATTVPLPG